jgi:hypothetical protein
VNRDRQLSRQVLNPVADLCPLGVRERRHRQSGNLPVYHLPDFVPVVRQTDPAQWTRQPGLFFFLIIIIKKFLKFLFFWGVTQPRPRTYASE